MGVAREALEMVLHGLVEQFVFGELVRKMPQLGAAGQTAHDDQVGYLDEGGFFGEFFDGYAAITENAAFTVNESDAALARAGVGVTVVQRDAAGGGAERGDINRALFFASFDDRQPGAFTIYDQLCHASGIHLVQSKTGGQIMCNSGQRQCQSRLSAGRMPRVTWQGHENGGKKQEDATM